jgi:hypothetical protein
VCLNSSLKPITCLTAIMLRCFALRQTFVTVYILIWTNGEWIGRGEGSTFHTYISSFNSCERDRDQKWVEVAANSLCNHEDWTRETYADMEFSTWQGRGLGSYPKYPNYKIPKLLLLRISCFQHKYLRLNGRTILR